MAANTDVVCPFDLTIDSHYGIVYSFERAEEVLKKFSDLSTSSFSVYKKEKGFGEDWKKDPNLVTKKIYFEDSSRRIAYDGTPYIRMRSAFYDCQHGLDRQSLFKEKYKQNKVHSKNKCFRVSSSRKVNCPAKVIFREVVQFPKFKMSSDTSTKRRNTSIELRQALKNDKAEGKYMIYIELPKEHKNHKIGTVKRRSHRSGKSDLVTTALIASSSDEEEGCSQPSYEEGCKNECSKSHSKMDNLLHYTSVNHADCLIGEINKLRRNEQLCDVLIIVGDYRIPAHRLILSACMPYFHSLLDKPRTNRPTEVVLSDIDGEATKNIIEFCYTSAISIREENVLMLLPTAFTFQLDEISNLCCDFLVSQLHPNNCLVTHQVAVQCACHDLQEQSAGFILKHFNEILTEDSFLELPVYSVSQALSCLLDDVIDNTQVLDALKKWVEHQNEDRQKLAPEIAYYFPKLVDKLKEFLPEDLLKMSVHTEDRDTASPVISNHDDNSKNMDSPISYLDSPNFRHSESPLPKYNSEDSFVSTNGFSMANSMTIICTICGEIFDSQSELDSHKQECDDSSTSAITDVPEFPTNSNMNVSSSSNHDYLNYSSSPKHSSSFHGFPCPICGKHFPCKKNLGKHIKIHSQYGFECEVCYKKYSTKSNLQGHMRIHSGEKPYNCEFCGKGFVSYCVLKVHIRTHTGEKPFPCPTCGVSFAKNIHLKRHLQIHTGTKPHRCDICSKHFSRSDHLKRHIQSIHSGAKPHSCSLCGKDFVRKYELNKHFKLHFATTMDGSLTIIDPNNDSLGTDHMGVDSPSHMGVDSPSHMGVDSPSSEAGIQEESVTD